MPKRDLPHGTRADSEAPDRVISLRTLGALELEDADGREVRAVLQQPKRLALLAYLALAGQRRFHRRDSLLALFWPDLDTEHARAALRRALYFLRQEIGEDVLVNRGEDEVGLAEGSLRCDAAEFERLLQDGQRAEALAHYHGDLLEGFYIAGAPDAERWLDERRAYLREQAARAAWALADAPEMDPRAAAEWARRAAAYRPDDEDGVRRLMKLLAKAGDRAAALRAYEEFARRLRKDLDAEPEADTSRIADSLRAAPPVPVPGPRSPVPGLVSVRPFTIHGDAALNYLAEGMVDLLSTALNGAGDLRATDPRTTSGAEYHLEGSVVAAGGKLRITAQLKRADTGEIAGRADAQREREQDLFELVDDVVRQLITGRIAGPGARLARLATVTTSSLPALKSYLAGEQDTRAGRHFEAFAAYATASQLDPDFALAHYRLAGACAATALIDEARDASARALAHAGRLTGRDRILLEAQHAWLHGRAADAERRYGTAVTMYPDDVEAWFLLGDVQFHSNPYRGRSVTEAREPLERVVALDSGHVGALVKLARIAALERRTGDVESLARQALAASPDGDQALAMRALRAFTLGNRDEQEEVLRLLPAARALPAVIAFGDVAVYAGDLAAAETMGRAFVAAARADELKALCHLMLAHLALAGGRRDAAWQALEQARPFAPSWTLEVRGLFAALPFVPLDANALAEVSRELEEWDTTAARAKVSFPLSLHNEVHAQLRAWLLGQIAARRGDAAAAVSWADALAELPVPGAFATAVQQMTRSLDAQVHRLHGRVADALQALEGATTDVWYQHAIASPFFAGTFDRYLRATLLAEAGRTTEARAWLDSLCQRSAWELPFRAPAEAMIKELP